MVSALLKKSFLENLSHSILILCDGLHNYEKSDVFVHGHSTGTVFRSLIDKYKSITLRNFNLYGSFATFHGENKKCQVLLRLW
jgi:hypothetical protein